MSSILRTHRPLLAEAKRWLKRAVLAPPRCSRPVGLGANLTRTPISLRSTVRMRRVTWYRISGRGLDATTMMELAANISFMFKERDFLDRFRAAAACGEAFTLAQSSLAKSARLNSQRKQHPHCLQDSVQWSLALRWSPCTGRRLLWRPRRALEWRSST